MLCDPVEHLFPPCRARRWCNQRLDNAFQPVDARTLDQHSHLRGCSTQGLGESRGFRKPLPSVPKALDCASRERTCSKQPLDSLLTSEDAHLRVRALGEVPQLRHVAEHEPLAAIETCKDFDTRAHR